MFIENLSARGTLVNDSRINGKVRLRLRDRIRVSDDTVVRLETEGGDSLVTQYRSLVILLVVIAVTFGLVLLAFDPFSTPELEPNWQKAQAALATYVDSQVAAKKYPPQMREYWDAAWRHDQAGNYKSSATVWLELQSMLQTCESTENLYPAQSNLNRFEKLLKSPDPDAVVRDAGPAAGALVVQFVNRRYPEAYRRAGAKKGLLE